MSRIRGKHHCRINWVGNIVAAAFFALAIAVIIAVTMTTPAPEGSPVSRTARTIAALTITASASVALAGTATADVTTNPNQSCTTNLVCAPINLPADAHNLLNITNSLNGGLLSGLL